MAIELVTIKYDGGELKNIQMSELDVNPDPEIFTDAEILVAVAQHMGIEPLEEFLVTRCRDVSSNEVTSVNIRPVAPYASV